MSENITHDTEQQKVNASAVEPETSAAAENEMPTENTFEQAQAPSIETPDKKKHSVKQALSFLQNKVLTPTVCRIVAIAFSGLLILLGLLQLLIWGITLIFTYNNYWIVLQDLDPVGIAMTVFAAIFVITFMVQLVITAVSLFKKHGEPNFALVTTLFAHYVFSLFARAYLGSYAKLISSLITTPVLGLMITLLVIYTVYRMFVKGFRSRLSPMLFSLGTIIMASILSGQKAGNFATFTMGVDTVSLAKLNAYRFFQSFEALVLSKTIPFTKETILMTRGLSGSIYEGELDPALLMPILQFIPIAIANILPFAALSLIGYLLFGLASRNSLQYYHLQSCRTMASTMMGASVFSIVCLFAMQFLGDMIGANFSVSINYINLITTILLLVFILVLTSLPWTLYNATYEHRYSSYLKKQRGGK